MATITHNRPQRSGAPLALFLLAVTVLAAALAIPEVGRVMETDHATDRHGADAQLTRQCLERSGPASMWQANDDDSIRFLTCQLDDGRWCIQIAQVWPSINQGVDYRERTAFCLGDVDRLLRYLKKRATQIR